MNRSTLSRTIYCLCLFGLLLFPSCTNTPGHVKIGMPFEEAVSVLEEMGLERAGLSIGVADRENTMLDTFAIDEDNYLILVGTRGEKDQWTLHSINQWVVGDLNVGRGHPDQFIETELQQWPDID